MCYLDPRAHRTNIQDTMYLVNWAFLFKRQYFKHFLWPLPSGWQWFCLKHRKLKTSQVGKVLTGAGLIWQKQVKMRIFWAGKLNFLIYIFNFNFQKLNLKVLNLIDFLMWQKQVRICWARKLNSFQPRIFSAQWGREGKIKVNFELRSIQAQRQKQKHTHYPVSNLQPMASMPPYFS